MKSKSNRKSVAIVQSSYIPWKGYFDLINMVDEFILLDDVQFTRRDWRNRNRIKVAGGTAWLTIPVRVSGRFRQRICDTVVVDGAWAGKHWKSIRQWYAKAPFFCEYRAQFEELYLGCDERFLSRVNLRFLSAICSILGIETHFSWSMDYPSEGGRSERLARLCRKLGAQEYVSGPTARSYLDESIFARSGIRVRWMDYGGYPNYQQLFPPFVHSVSVLDLIFCEGPKAQRFMKSFQQ